MADVEKIRAWFKSGRARSCKWMILFRGRTGVHVHYVAKTERFYRDLADIPKLYGADCTADESYDLSKPFDPQARQDRTWNVPPRNDGQIGLF